MRDVIIIGAGPGGMTAALYASRAELSVLVLEGGIPGGQMNNTAEVENYPGVGIVQGPELAEKMLADSSNFGAEHAYGFVTEIEDHGDYKTVVTDDERYDTKAVIIATGSEHRKLGAPGEEEFGGRGVSYCAVCDGPFFRNKHLVVVGGGDSAVEEGSYLTQVAEKVTVIHRRDKLRAQKILQERAFKNEKMEFIWNTTVEEIVGDDRQVTGLRLKNTETGEVTDFAADGVFIYVGLDPLSKPFASLGITDESGWIETDAHMATKVPGIYAIGDVRATVLRQVATAVGDGSIAGQEVYKYIEALND
ncbi:thioredoxin-disulfide reductase [Vagococcus coleopterorum]|uniref:Thioredoxin reductase n=1 Tax=Vagococcus coleopterorum TaxID=2714946 RepID=A0A6G8ANS5_9ENTE|nr:thioredoxin-disulfide reductase [Vagococcus coleopterorum]QIL46728.1 thioredoxin-disulfide reductase [Vagococcus coleopterorum]